MAADEHATGRAANVGLKHLFRAVALGLLDHGLRRISSSTIGFPWPDPANEVASASPLRRAAACGNPTLTLPSA